MILGILTTIVGIFIYYYIFPPIGGAISIIGFLWFSVEVIILILNFSKRNNRNELYNQENDDYIQYKTKRITFPTSDETMELAEKLFINHNLWLQKCTEEIENAFKKNWDNRKYFISQEQGVVFTSPKAEDLDKLFNHSKHYRLVCEYLNREIIKELEEEIEEALLHIQQREEIYNSMD